MSDLRDKDHAGFDFHGFGGIPEWLVQLMNDAIRTDRWYVSCDYKGSSARGEYTIRAERVTKDACPIL